MEAAAPSSGAHVPDAYEMSHRLVSAVQQGNRAAVGRLLSRGNSTNRPVRDLYGLLYPLLHLASECGHADVVILLLDHEAAIDARSPEGATALLIASEHNHLAVVRCLLDRRASVNLSDIRGRTPLFAASQRGYLPIARLLIERGAVIDAAGDTGDTPLTGACFNGHERIAQLLE